MAADGMESAIIMNVLTRNRLDLMATAGCEACGHDSHVIFFHSRCHPKAATWAKYTSGDGVLTITCSVCERIIAEVQVSEKLKNPPTIHSGEGAEGCL